MEFMHSCGIIHRDLKVGHYMSVINTVLLAWLIFTFTVYMNSYTHMYIYIDVYLAQTPNVLVTRDILHPTGAVAKIADFGLSRAMTLSSELRRKVPCS